jgi:hypothetical protein
MPSRDIDVDGARGWIAEDVCAENFTLYDQATPILLLRRIYASYFPLDEGTIASSPPRSLPEIPACNLYNGHIELIHRRQGANAIEF